MYSGMWLSLLGFSKVQYVTDLRAVNINLNGCFGCTHSSGFLSCIGKTHNSMPEKIDPRRSFTVFLQFGHMTSQVLTFYLQNNLQSQIILFSNVIVYHKIDWMQLSNKASTQKILLTCWSCLPLEIMHPFSVVFCKDTICQWLYNFAMRKKHMWPGSKLFEVVHHRLLSSEIYYTFSFQSIYQAISHTKPILDLESHLRIGTNKAAHPCSCILSNTQAYT